MRSKLICITFDSSINKNTTMKNTAIAITLGTDENGALVHITVWAADSVCVYESYDLTSDESRKWLAKIDVKDGKKYYPL